MSATGLAIGERCGREHGGIDVSAMRGGQLGVAMCTPPAAARSWQRCALQRSAHMLGFEKRQHDLVGLCGLWLPVPDGAVGHDVAVGAPPLDLASLELLLV